MRVLVTGSAGFIGNSLALELLRKDHEVVGIDSVTPYYDPSLKEARIDRLRNFRRFTEARIDLVDHPAVEGIFESFKPEAVVNLAAQPGVRYSLENPQSYVQSNIVGFLPLLEGCRRHDVGHFVFASTSSVYGATTRQPFSEHDPAVHPMTLYAATKRANELMAHSYSHLFGIPTTAVRFFTVYGPWARPDMALLKFTQAILAGQPIDIYNHGDLERDFVYIDDIVESIVRLMAAPPKIDPDFDQANPDAATSGNAPYRVHNIGSSRKVNLMTYIETLEKALGKKAIPNMLPMQKGDIPSSLADISSLNERTGFRPKTSIEDGIGRFVEWYRQYYAV
ncbi:MAG: NAD-dependent epimerase [Pseudaminobacter sp.]|nr:NAD-dependent epimerase [Pseudaminobacter sp.]